MNRNAWYLIIVLAGALTLIACSKTPASPAPRTRVRVAEYPHLVQAPLYVAQDEGFFAEEGIDVDFVPVDFESPVALAALVHEEIDVDSVPPRAAFLNAIARGAKFRFVAGEARNHQGGCPQWAWVVRSDWWDASGHFDVSRLRGARVFYMEKSWSEYLLELALRDTGVKVSDMTRVTLQGHLLEQALAQHDVDVCYMSELRLQRVLAGKTGRIWKLMSEVIPDAPVGTLAFNPRLLGANREVGVRFLTAYLRAERSLIRGKTTRNVEIIARHLNLPASEVASCCWVSFQPDGEIAMRAWLAFEKWAFDKGVVDRMLSSDEIADASLAAEARRRLDARSR